jgi:hypothetical protein
MKKARIISMITKAKIGVYYLKCGNDVYTENAGRGLITPVKVALRALYDASGRLKDAQSIIETNDEGLVAIFNEGAGSSKLRNTYFTDEDLRLVQKMLRLRDRFTLVHVKATPEELKMAESASTKSPKPNRGKKRYPTTHPREIHVSEGATV